ncbi:hypothetical protein F5B22DRAFT_636987 [Xylaria bambusicola]|uniref:uncharacterized protein n=1 Tax=Xylaria bambusicola TaxID=326684 RepID=UPI002008CA47|nr:uncharacterized protein F5B22DRAFT_636987 [Xylaria bambusicola]KAI0514673.1 hypothetical protein F5B22DRAFT_636987 [Xylaria bambusicola]
MSDREDYTIGWICALGIEFVSARAFLDEELDISTLSIPSGDENQYVAGRIGQHNVIIATMPEGMYGTASTSRTVSNLVHSFPNIRFCLSVGIGGGVPSERHDIRLGDVAVSMPQGANSGVIQWDFGKAIQNGEFRRTGSFDAPPVLLRSALSRLRADHEINGHSINENIDAALHRYPRLRSSYGRQDTDSDRLFKSNVQFSELEDPAALIARAPRIEYDTPMVHYGTIASGNQVLKDAVLRDKLSAADDILCFEMEAAGLMNITPCLIIRGISDYCDSYKTKNWQRYAAMTAAAYAKELLGIVAASNVSAVRTTSRVHIEARGRDILEWLTIRDFNAQQHDLSRIRTPGTGMWLLESEDFQIWLASPKRTLLCRGLPGAGKTILTSGVIADLTTRFSRNTSIGVAFIYLNYRDREQDTPEDLLLSLLKQLSESQRTLPDSVKALYDSHSRLRSRPLLKEILACLEAVTAIYSRVFIVIDALDECKSLNNCRTKLLQSVFQLQAKCGVNIFATSRIDPSIESKFEKAQVVDMRGSRDDIVQYLDEGISQLPGFVQRNPELKIEIKQRILDVSGGMFLMARHLLESLSGKWSPKAVKMALENMSSTTTKLSMVYDDIIERVSSQDLESSRLAYRVLSWLVFQERPLLKAELQHALAVEPGEDDFDEDNLPEIEHIVSLCNGLVTLEEKTGILRIVHLSAYEYLHTKLYELVPQAEADIATALLAYLSLRIFETGACPTDSSFEERLRSYPLYSYAARYWGAHCRKLSNTGSPVMDLIMNFLKSGNNMQASLQATLASECRDIGYSQKTPENFTPLHVPITATDHSGRSVMSWAAEKGLDNIMVKLLSRKHHHLKVADAHGRTPMSWAAEGGHSFIVELLVKKDGVEDSPDKFGQTPLWWAARYGHLDIVKFLLEAGDTNPNNKDMDYGGTSLCSDIQLS